MEEPQKRKRESTEPEQQQQSSSKPIDGLTRLPKRRVAIMVAYYGKGYQGSQINPNTKTIEGTLFNAFVRAGCITQDNSSHPNKVGLQRAARTDANVSACCNLISLKLILNPPEIEQNDSKDSELDLLHRSLIEQHSQTSYYPLIKHINRFLPSELKVWEIIRVQNSFNPRSLCDSRVYEYSLPTWLFLPPKPGSPLHQRLDKLRQKNGVQKEGNDPEAVWWDAHSDLLEKDFKSIQAEKRRSYRISKSMIDRIKSVLDQYKGTHNFHNLTVGKAFTERNAVRIMKDFTVSEPFLVGGSTPTSSNDGNNDLENLPTEWISITFHGQSFMLHQIRKMIGLLVLVCRTRTPVTMIKQLYGPQKVSIPKAPGIGLILRKLNFHGYNKKIQHINKQTIQQKQKRKKKGGGSQAQNQDDDQLMVWDSIECDRFEALFERFKLETLFKRIYLNQSPSNEPHNTQPITGDVQLDSVSSDIDPKKEEEKAGSIPATDIPTKPSRSVKGSKNDDDDDDEDGHEEEDDEVVPSDNNQEGEDPFGVWMNYLDVYTGQDLDFLNPDGVLPAQEPKKL
ncbi:hypothetical protein MJO28_003485 [Puccinia striiformis f. sp. tritici]|uniref:tRNA pseudouridylate synthase 2 n=2 Tax=Puccinia striiformis TaxID=27350 RepID=A0A2S4VG76_9BASI|nr:hypothetical protein MJO28_003485 [Puccinia striiformis f. sp. tritici]POW08534.1 hypothetical protein PSTT_07445 [Puccinia striiformis]